MRKHPFVGLAGNIGVGKTTFTEKMADAFGWSPIYESVADNPYLSAQMGGWFKTEPFMKMQKFLPATSMKWGG